MAPVYKFSNVGGFTSKTFYTSILAGNPKAESDNGSVFPLGEFTLASAQANIEFTNIPQTYTHLQLRIMTRCSTAGTAQDEVQLQMGNGSIDTSSNYAYHFIYGNGTSVIASAGSNQTYIRSAFSPRTSSTASSFGVAIIDILDYRSTNKNKTIRSLGGADLNDTNGLSALLSGLWKPATPVAITNIRIKPEGSSTFLTNSYAALYGVLA